MGRRWAELRRKLLHFSLTAKPHAASSFHRARSLQHSKVKKIGFAIAKGKEKSLLRKLIGRWVEISLELAADLKRQLARNSVPEVCRSPCASRIELVVENSTAAEGGSTREKT